MSPTSRAAFLRVTRKVRSNQALTRRMPMIITMIIHTGMRTGGHTCIVHRLPRATAVRSRWRSSAMESMSVSSEETTPCSR